jgi:hypothetical protein
MTATGETELASLLKGMRPVLQPGILVFATVPPGGEADIPMPAVLGTFREAEGVTLILPQQAARDAGLAHSAPNRQITLTVHSSLEAVGLTAAISTALARHGISANVVAAYFHDHVFVPEGDGERALAILKGLSQTG